MVNRPSVNIFQDFQVETVVPVPEMPPVVIGPRHDFLDYANSDDKAKAFVGDYDNTQDTEYAYPDKFTLSDVLQDTVEVWFDDAKIKYLDKAAGSGSYEVRAITKAKNRITTVAAVEADRLSFQEYTNSAGTVFSRSTEFDDRDVKLGDAVEVSASIGANKYTTKTEVKGIVNEVIDDIVGAATADSGNQGAQSESSAIVGSAVSVGGDTLSISGTYAGSLKDDVLTDEYVITVLAQGGDPVIGAAIADAGNSGDSIVASGGSFDAELQDTYTVEVTTGGAPLTAVFKITSTRGDDVASLTSVAYGAPLQLTDRGVSITVTDGGSGLYTLGDKWTIAAAPSNGRLSIYTDSGKDDVPNRVFPGFDFSFVLGDNGLSISIADGGDSKITEGDTWTVSGQMEIVAPVATSSGDYDHTKDLVYTIEVVQGGIWGEAQIFCSSTGVDSSGPYIVTAPVTDFPVGLKGVEVQFAANAQGGLVKGDKYTISAEFEKKGAVKTLILNKNLNSEIIAAATTLGSLTKTATGGSSDTTATLSGTFTDSEDGLATVVQEKLTVSITESGEPGVGTPKFAVASASGKYTIAETLIAAYAAPYAIGGGLFITFVDGGAFDPTIGDVWEVTIDGTNLDLKLMIVRQDFMLGRQREDAGFDTAWESDAENVTVMDAIKLADSEWKSGTEYLPVEEAKIYVAYQAIRTAVVGSIDKIDDRDKIEDTLGRISIKNPLAYGVDKCMENANFKEVYYFPVASDDVDGHKAFLTLAENVEFTQLMVPLTFEKDIQDEYISHVNEFSVPAHGKWRRVFISRERPETDTLFGVWYKPNSTIEEDFLGTITDYVETSATDYIFVEASEDGDPNFIQANVREGDFYRTLYKTNTQGVMEWTDYEIAGVISETTLLLKAGPSTAVAVPEKFTIYRKLSSSEMVTKIAADAKLINDRRVSYVYPDYITDDDSLLVPGYYLCCAIAGMVTATPAHQGLTNYKVEGFTDTARSYVDLTISDMDTLADGGVFIVTQETKGSEVFVRHQLTTDVTVIEFQELSIGTNVDNISFFFKNILDEMIGIYNINDDTLDLMRTKLEAGIEDLKSVTDTTAGPQLIDARIKSLLQDETLKDQVRVDMIVTIPYPLNVINVHLII
jgi:hypothetical protein